MPLWLELHIRARVPRAGGVAKPTWPFDQDDRDVFLDDRWYVSEYDADW